MAKYDVFISGETMDLVCPNEKAILEDGWHNWFNDKKTTRFLRQGNFPHTIKDQLEYLESIRHSKDRLVVLIKPKALGKVVGVCSLSEINYVEGSAGFALVIGDRNYKAKHKEMIGLEAKSRLIEHAFEVLGLKRIFGHQVTDLRKWHSWQVLLGFRTEGFLRKASFEGYRSLDSLISAVLLNDYLNLKKLRGGVYWPGAKKMLQLIKALPKESYDQKLENILNREWEKYSRSILYI